MKKDAEAPNFAGMLSPEYPKGDLYQPELFLPNGPYNFLYAAVVE